MSDVVSIKMSGVTEVLLSDGWHVVKSGSFGVGQIVFLRDNNAVESPGTHEQLPAAKWLERDGGLRVVCPWSAILAIKGN